MLRNRLLGRWPSRTCDRSVVSLFVLLALSLGVQVAHAAENMIEEQLQEIGSIPNEEVMVVQRKYTRKRLRHELTPITIGGFPFNPVRRTLFAGASYILHLNDTYAWEALNFSYTKNFFGSFIDEINTNKTRPNQNDIKSDYQKLLFSVSTGLQIAPFYGKMATFGKYIAFMEPYFAIGIGYSKTEQAGYVTATPGFGMRIYFKEWFSMRVELRDYIYTEKFIDRATGQKSSALRNNFAVIGALSFWLPKM